ncbi:P1 family peptidase [Cryptosporangium japonicum]|uniref:P1 family peptidase n=1 Tax=Cryptosporangium japonicum TaxID=80872 RepID=A0ABN0V311_9ACTN
MEMPTVVRAGKTNSLVDVPGIRVGQAQRRGDGWLSGVTVVLPPPDGAVGGVDVRGGGPGTRETDVLDPRKLVEKIHGIVLTGGSAFGLASIDGVVNRLADHGIGFPVGNGVVPIVPGAVIFDLSRGGDFRSTPDAALGAAAYDAATDDVSTGSVGAGTGAVAGGLAGGVGTASAVLSDGYTVAALAVVNAAGSAVDPRTGLLHGAADGLPGEFDLRAPDPAEVERWTGPAEPGRFNFNTTLGVIATDAPLSKAGCGGLASAAHDGLARALRPAHTITDGDTVFALSTGVGEPLTGVDQRAVQIVAADCLSRAIAHGVLAASDRPDARSYRALFPSAIR